MGLKVERDREQLSNNRVNTEIILAEPINSEVDSKDGAQNDSKMDEKEFTEKDIKKAVEKLNVFLEDENTHAEFSMHKTMHRIMIKIVDNETEKVILEIPPKKLVDMVAKMCELAGVLVDRKA